MNKLVDTHCHLYLEDFKEDIDAVITRANEEGVQEFFLPNIDSGSIKDLMELCKKFPGQCYPMMGLHPCSVKENFEDELKIVKSNLEKKVFAAVGEIGLDFYWDKTFTNQQYKVFQQQIDWAKEFKIPIVIHSRESMQECIDMVKKNQDGNLNGIFHCFTGDLDSAKQIIDLGFYLGIGGVLTYKKSNLAETLEKVDVHSLVLETDAPYLTPVPFRGKRNENFYFSYIAANIGEVKNISVEEIARITTENSNKIFKLKTTAWPALQ